MCCSYLEAKEERKSNGSQNTNSGKKCLRVEIERGIKEQKRVNDHEEFEFGFGWSPSAFGGKEVEFG